MLATLTDTASDWEMVGERSCAPIKSELLTASSGGGATVATELSLTSVTLPPGPAFPVSTVCWSDISPKFSMVIPGLASIQHST